MTPVRLGAVSYLNARPLVQGLDRDPRFALRTDVPSRCADLLHAGAIDLGLVPSIELLRGEHYRIVPDVAIASAGAVASVAIFSTRPLDRVRRIVLDTSSRTSVALTRVLCAERFGIAPAFAPAAPDLDRMLAAADAALLIGDAALFADHERRGLLKIDLGAEWAAHTGLPFVWAFWAGRPGPASPAVCRALAEARDRGLAAIPRIAADYGQGDPARTAQCEGYLRTNIEFVLTARHVEALERFYRSAHALGLVDRPGPLGFFDV